MDIQRDVEAKIWKYTLNETGRNIRSKPFEVMRVAILAEDISKFNLPPLRIKVSDSRASQFLKRYGKDCVEVDALPPSELRGWLSRVIQGLIEQEAWQRAMAVERAERQTTQRVAAALRSLPTTQPIADAQE